MLYCARKKKYIFRKRRCKDMAQYEQWAGFKGRNWTHSVDVRSFIQDNYTPYEGDDSFLAGPTEATTKLGLRLWTFLNKSVKLAEY